MKTLTIILGLLLTCLTSCNTAGNDSPKGKVSNDAPNKKVQIYLQPYDNISSKRVEEVKAQMIACFQQEIPDEMIIEILPAKALDASLKNDFKTRFRADKILDSMGRRTGGKVIIGMTDHDISCTSRGANDWGVLGLARMGRNKCVVSSYRLRDKHQLWKVAAHEFLHAYYSLGHCKEDNSHCYIQDGHGKANVGIKNMLCPTCKKEIWN